MRAVVWPAYESFMLTCELVQKPSNFFTPAYGRIVRGIVIHTAECGEQNGAELGVGGWFQNPNAKVSAHYVAGQRRIVQCVAEHNIAWHAGPANDWTIGIELPGTAKQTEAEWNDDASKLILFTAAELCADICRRHGLPITKLDPAELSRPSAKGIFGHVDVTRGLKSGTHWDPGPAFPWTKFIDQVMDISEAA